MIDENSNTSKSIQEFLKDQNINIENFDFRFESIIF